MIFAGRQIVKTECIDVLIVYAEPEQFWQQELQLPVGATVHQALSQIDLNCFPEHMKLNELRFAVFGKAIKPNEHLHNHDRIEILRPLLRDPKDNRRQRAELNPYKKLKKY